MRTDWKQTIALNLPTLGQLLLNFALAWMAVSLMTSATEAITFTTTFNTTEVIPLDSNATIVSDLRTMQEVQSDLDLVHARILFLLYSLSFALSFFMLYTALTKILVYGRRLRKVRITPDGKRYIRRL